MNRLILAYRPRPPGDPAWPADPRLRFLAYLLAGIAAWLVPPWGALAAIGLAAALGRRERWGRWLLSLGWFWLFVLAPLAAELIAQAGPLGAWLVGLTDQGRGMGAGSPGGHGGRPGWLALALQSGLDLPALLAAAWRCLTFLALMMASQWFTGCTTVFEIQAVLAFLLRPLGRRAAGRLSFLVALAIGFIPWTLDEIAAVQEASLVRAGGRRGLRVRFAAFGLPVFVRVLAKARHTAEAIELRGGW